MTGYVFDLCIHSMNTVVVGESMVMFVDYTVTPNEKSDKRMKEVLFEKRREEHVVKGTEAEAEGIVSGDVEGRITTEEGGEES